MKIHVEWGAAALNAKADIVVIVDCLSFSTATTVATAKGARVFPFGLQGEVAAFAEAMAVVCAQRRSLGGLSLSPATLTRLGKDDAIILPSPNGAHLTLYADAPIVIAGCLRNARAVADFINISGVKNVQFVAAGERWQHGGLRPAFEDWIACGAVLNQLNGILTAEAGAAAASFRWAEPQLQQMMKNCLSGQELTAQNFEQDVDWASELSTANHVPIVRELEQTYSDFGVRDEKLKSVTVKYYESI
ncbi:MAG: hypothetical protein COB24_10610 [Hyphomicrobiales bacterium]|nr:MAG: hypothetical protein COB24_10610 [Hyphomicrobiales bacterium]